MNYNSQQKSVTPTNAADIKHMGDVIAHRAATNQKCFIHSNDERIAVKDENDVVIVWVKSVKE